jgi:hypothetical protein
MTADPWTDPDTEAPAREREAQKALRLRMPDLMERHVFIVPKRIEDKDGDNGPYSVVVSDVIVLDGRETEKIPSLPHTVYVGQRWQCRQRAP